MSGESRLRHVAAMDPPGRGSISTEEAAEVLARVAALEAELRTADEAEAERKVECPELTCPCSFVSRVPMQAERRLILHWNQVHSAALDAVPAGTPRTLTDEEITDEDAKGTCPVHDR